MRQPHRRTPRRSRLSLATSFGVLVVALTVVPMPAVAAPLCLPGSAAKTLEVTAQTTSVVIDRTSTYLTVNDITCALLTDTDRVEVDMAGFANASLSFSLANGELGPGFTDEGNGSSEIEFDVSGFASGGTVSVIGGAGADSIAVGTRVTIEAQTQELNLNVASDGATRDADVVVRSPLALVELVGGDGADVLTGAGVGGIGSRAYFYPMRLDPGRGADVATGGAGDDRIDASAGLGDEGDVYSGGGGIDSFYLSILTSRLGYFTGIFLDDEPNDGHDCPSANCEGDDVRSDIERLFGRGGNDTFVGGPGPQLLSGGGREDELYGRGGDDLLVGLEGADRLYGGRGDDTLYGGPGPDLLRGGLGFDTVTYEGTRGGISVSLDDVSNDGGSGENDFVDPSDIERVLGTRQSDTFIGNGAANTFDGLAGDDVFIGRRGDDELFGRAGDDTFDGGPGSDRCAQGAGTGTKVDCER